MIVYLSARRSTLLPEQLLCASKNFFRPGKGTGYGARSLFQRQSTPIGSVEKAGTRKGVDLGSRT